MIAYRNVPETLEVMVESILKIGNPLPDDKILDWSKLKQIADDFLKCI